MINASYGDALKLGPRYLPLPVINGFHVRIGTHVDGIRDPEHPCYHFRLGKPSHLGHCLSDGHYACGECTELDVEGRAQFTGVEP